MKPRTEEFLYFLSWALYALGKPTWRSLTYSYEAWAYGEGLWRQAGELERKKLLEWDKPNGRSGSTDRILRLTDSGCVHALGGRDPQAWWNRGWDGRWRAVIFDVPIAKRSLRDKLRRYLSAHSFGCLQQSVWITPDPLEEEKKLLQGAEADTASLLTLEARPAMGETDEEIVARTWDFEEINRRYSKVLEILEEQPGQALETEAASSKFRKWAAQERAAWFAAVSKDPLLPGSLLPPDYLGRKAWNARAKALRLAWERIAGFKLRRAEK